MGVFLSQLDVTLTKDDANDGRGAWVVDSPLVYWSMVTDETYTVPTGFTTDFASVPRLPIVFNIAGDTAHRASVLHDWLYTTKTVTRELADRIYLEAMQSTKVDYWKCILMYAAVRLLGSKYYGRD